MEYMTSTASELSLKCLQLFELCLNTQRPQGSDSEEEPGNGTSPTLPEYYKESLFTRFECRMADFNLWIDGIGALAPSKASLDSRLRDRPIDLSLVKGNLTMLSQALENCKSLIERGLSAEESFLDIDSTLESLVALALAIRRTGRKSRLHKTDCLFNPEEHTELKQHLECIVILRPGMEGRESDHQYQLKVQSLSPLQRHLIEANLRRRNRFIQAQLHSVGLKSRASAVGQAHAWSYHQPLHEPIDATTENKSASEAPSIAFPPRPDEHLQSRPVSVTTATYPSSKLHYSVDLQHKTESSPMTVITKITASARYPRPRFGSNQTLVQCPCCCQMLSVAEVKNDKMWSRHIYMFDILEASHWDDSSNGPAYKPEVVILMSEDRKHLSEDVRPYTCVFDNCPTPNVYYSSREMLERHFRHDHTPVWQCPECKAEQIFTTMTAMIDHLQASHTFTTELSDISPSSMLTRMGINACPLCNTMGPPDSPALIDHVLEHVHDFSLRSLPWPKSADVELGGEVGSYNDESGDEGAALTYWLEGSQTECGEAPPCLQLSTYDHNRLSKMNQLIHSGPRDTPGIGIYFADEEEVESAEAEDGNTVSVTKQASVDEEEDITVDESAPEAQRSKRQRLFERATKPFKIFEGRNFKTTPGYAEPLTNPGFSEEDIRQSTELLTSLKLSEGDALPNTKLLTLTVVRPSRDSVTSAASALFGSGYVLPPWNQTTLNVLFTLYREILGLSIHGGETATGEDCLTLLAFMTFSDSVQGQTVAHFMQPLAAVGSIDASTFIVLMLRFCVEGLQAPQTEDTSRVISDYFINTSHGIPAPMGRGPTNPPTIIDEYRKMLTGGCRVLEANVWNGDQTSHSWPNIGIAQRLGTAIETSPSQTTASVGSDCFQSNVEPPMALTDFGTIGNPNEPLVITKPDAQVWCTFRELCIAVRESAFVSTDLPVILRLDVFAESTQQAVMSQIMHVEWGNYLFDEGYDSSFGMPKLDDLRNKIIVDLLLTRERFKPSFNYSLKLIGNWIREESFLTLPSPREPLHCNPTWSHITDDPGALEDESFRQWKLIRHLEKNLCHVLHPRRDTFSNFTKFQPVQRFRRTVEGNILTSRDTYIRSQPDNHNPVRLWGMGIQMAAIDRDQVDTGMMINHAMFAGGSGWELKSHDYLGSSTLHYLSVLVFEDQRFKIEGWEGDLSSLFTAELHTSTWDSGERFSWKRYFDSSVFPDFAGFANPDHEEEGFDEYAPWVEEYASRGRYVKLPYRQNIDPKEACLPGQACDLIASVVAFV
ncbi:uncharacterized protein B0J16DRAFT_393889 [Fusarium flagelliforme]|uniref:uncharacterized protein n=1 Tax=Fusarium flagelliforme TaxID=2675880 RepID=UPI001E8CDB9D|nr:uncharacterized protein B0J16DRAFT_393889 [Fusarium flagelliforme]KAH7191838.1 hypothetical protein B0J16DRAFT_393889 [Fusarium flagelliforme]